MFYSIYSEFRNKVRQCSHSNNIIAIFAMQGTNSSNPGGPRGTNPSIANGVHRSAHG